MQSRVRAIILGNDTLLTVKRVKTSETYWVFPGGGIEDGEENEVALIRECKEELGVEIKIVELLFENSFINDKDGEQKEFFYRCAIVGGELGTGSGPEYQKNSGYKGTRTLEWINLGKLSNLDVRPVEARGKLLDEWKYEL